jgi:hypothetical protein
MDVIEMDAASNTGVDNMREIIDSVRYAPVQARYKVYIIDEVHMLSKERLQRAAEDAGRAAAACEVHLRHDRDQQGSRHHPVALPALRPEAAGCGTARLALCQASPSRKVSRQNPTRWP